MLTGQNNLQSQTLGRGEKQGEASTTTLFLQAPTFKDLLFKNPTFTAKLKRETEITSPTISPLSFKLTTICFFFLPSETQITSLEQVPFGYTNHNHEVNAAIRCVTVMADVTRKRIYAHINRDRGI